MELELTKEEIDLIIARRKTSAAHDAGQQDAGPAPGPINLMPKSVKQVVLIVGGNGFVGKSLAKELYTRQYRVVIMDIVKSKNTKKYAEFVKGDMTDAQFVTDTIETVKPDIVINVASWGMSGSPMLSQRCLKINVEGMQNLIAGCLECNVSRLIYTSTYNVVFGGKEIIEGDESYEYFPLNGHTDQYSPSKAMAEQVVLEANGKTLKDGRMLCTAVLRPAAIYGEGEERHFPRIVRHIDSGIFNFRIGKAIVDWVHVENLIQAYLLLAEKMLQDSPVVNGQKYFISDGTPVDNFEFLRPLCASRDAKYPTLVLPLSMMLYVGFFFEKLYLLCAVFGLHVEPLMTRTEVYKVGVTHYFSIKKARNELGYNPAITSSSGAERMAKHYYNPYSNDNNENFFRFPSLIMVVLVIFGMVVLWLFAFASSRIELPVDLVSPTPYDILEFSMITILHHLENIGYLIFREQIVLQVVFYLAVGTHFFEAYYAYRMARNMGCSNTMYLWFWSTFLFGYPSFVNLIAHRDWIAREKDLTERQKMQK